jgi:hypothetical protein
MIAVVTIIGHADPALHARDEHVVGPDREAEQHDGQSEKAIIR